MASLFLLCKEITSSRRERDANNILSFLCNTCFSVYSTWEKEDEKNETQHVKREEVSSVRINFLRCFFQCVFMQRNCSDTSHKKSGWRKMLEDVVEKKKKDLKTEEDGKRMSVFYDSMNDMNWMNLITSLSINWSSFWLQQSHPFLSWQNIKERSEEKTDTSNITLRI